MNSNKNIPQLRFPGFTGEWEEKKLGDVCNLINGMAFKPSDWRKEGLPIVRIQNLNNEKSEFNYCDPDIVDSKYIIDDGTLLFSWSGTPGTSFGAYVWNRGKAALNQHIFIVKPKDIEKYFLRMSIDANMSAIIEKSHGGAGLRHITKSELEDISIFVPSNSSEQLKIAECLSEIDNQIVAQGEKVEALKEKKKGMTQQMFPQQGETTPRLRFPGFTEEWVEKNFSEVFTRRTEKNAENNKNVLTISAQYGLISQLEFFKKSVSAADVTGYYLLHKGDFAYNKSSSQGKPVGAIKPLKLYDKGVVSTLYIVFRCKDPNAIGFWEQYFDAGIFDKEIMSIAQEGARNHGLLNVPTNDFFNLKVLTPNPSEQLKIAKCLSAMDDMIASESAKLDALKDHKKGLMQQLFPQPNK